MSEEEQQQNASRTSSGGNPEKVVKWPGGIVHYVFHSQFSEFDFCLVFKIHCLPITHRSRNIM